MEFKLGPPPFSGRRIEAGAPAVARVVPSMFRANRIAALALALTILALAGGCGGGKEEVTAAELDQKGGQICQEEQGKFNQIQSQPLANASVAADQTKHLVQVSETAQSALDDLEPPDELRTALDSYLSARARAIDQMRKGQEAAENQDSAAYAAAQSAVVKTAPE